MPLDRGVQLDLKGLSCSAGWHFLRDLYLPQHSDIMISNSILLHPDYYQMLAVYKSFTHLLARTD